MLTSLKIEGFKSIEKADLNFGKLNIFIGTNASGKSNLLDVFKFLQGLGYGFTIDEILNGKSKTNSSIEWDSIRGGSENILFKTRNKNGISRKKTAFSLESILNIDNSICGHRIMVDSEKGKVLFEKLLDVDFNVFETNFKEVKGYTHHVKVNVGKKGRSPVVNLNEHNSSLQQILSLHELGIDEKRNKLMRELVDFFADQQKLDFIPSVLRQYSNQASATRIGERGENFASVVKNIISDEKTSKEYIGWLKKITPNEIDDIEIGKGALNDLMFGIKENNAITYAPSLSDGTLRFAAITAALFQPSPPKVLLIEEIENGIHPTRMRLLMELLMTRAEKGNSQIFITTHSPVLLDWIKKEYYDNVFFCTRKQNASTEIKPVTSITNFKETIKKYSLSELFTEGWLETTV